MGIQGGRKGNGMHKMGTSGASHPSARTKQGIARIVNNDAEDIRARRPKNPMFKSLKEALQHNKPR